MNAFRQLKDKIASYVFSSNDSYKFVLTPAELEKSENKWVQEFRGRKWTLSNPEYESKEKNTGQQQEEQEQKKIPGYTIGSKQIYKDADRDMRINNVCIKRKFQEYNKEFQEYLLKEFKTKENVDLLDQHFSQLPSYVAINPLVACAGLRLGDTHVFARPGSLEKENHEMKSNLYEKDGEIYYKSTVDRFPIKDQDNKIAGYVPGPIEVFFKLDQQKGFVLQNISTNSSLVRDIVMGVNVTEARIVAATEKYASGMDKIEQVLNKRENEITKWLNDRDIKLPIASDALYSSSSSKVQSKALNLDRIKIAKDIISEYRRGDLSIAETHAILSNLLEKENTPKNFGYVGRFFPVISTTTRALKSALAELERTTGYKPSSKSIASSEPIEQAKMKGTVTAK